MWNQMLMPFNPRTYIRYDQTEIWWSAFTTSFNPRTYIRYDLPSCTVTFSVQKFQSTYLYKVRRWRDGWSRFFESFNPRTYIRYDKSVVFLSCDQDQFQSTYLYKVRQRLGGSAVYIKWFQSTYLYKVRLSNRVTIFCISCVSIHVPI